MCERLLPSFTSPFVSFVNIAFTDLLTELLQVQGIVKVIKINQINVPSRRLKGREVTLKLTTEWGRVNAPDIKCCRGWLVLRREVCRGM